MDNPFLQRGQREADEAPSLPNPDENPFASAQGRAAITTAVGVVNASTPAQREGAQRLATHVVKKGCSIGFGSVWLPGCCGGESSRVKVRWHVTLIVVPVLTFVNTMRYSFSLDNLFLTLAGIPLLFVAVLLNQIGQLVMVKAHGGTPSHIVLWPLGGMAVLHSPTMSLGARVRIALAGPATHVPMLLFWIFLFSCTGCRWTIEEMHASSVGGIFVGSLFAAQAELNLYLLAFNLLVPCLPLDGATVIVSGLVGCGLRPLTAAKVVVAMSCVSLAMLATLVLTALFSRTLDPSLPLLTLVWLLWRTYHLYRACGDGTAAVGKHALFKDLPTPGDEPASGLQAVGSAASPPSSSTRRSKFASMFGGGGGGSSSGGGGGGGDSSNSGAGGGGGGGGGGLAVATGAVWPPPSRG